MRLRAAGQITDGAQAFFNYVLEYATADGLCSHGLATICARLAKGERMVRYYIAALAKIGLIRVTKAAGRYGTRIFEVVIPAQATEPERAPEQQRPARAADRPRFFSQRHGERPELTAPKAFPAPPEGFDRDRVRVQREDARWPLVERAWRAATGKALPQDHRFGWFVPRRFVEAAAGAGG